MTPANPTDREPEVVELIQDYMVDHPLGGYYALWNGPVLLDIGAPSGGFFRFPLVSLPPRWTRLMDDHGSPLPVAAWWDGQRLAVCWLPYEGPAGRPIPQTRGGVSDADIVNALQKMSTARYNAGLEVARHIGGWSTIRRQ